MHRIHRHTRHDAKNVKNSVRSPEVAVRMKTLELGIKNYVADWMSDAGEDVTLGAIAVTQGGRCSFIANLALQ